jgi:hypothetical protein
MEGTYERIYWYDRYDARTFTLVETCYGIGFVLYDIGWSIVVAYYLGGVVWMMNNKNVHWVAFKMSQLTPWDIEMAHAWISVNRLTTPDEPIPVMREFLYKLLELAKKQLTSPSNPDIV